MNIVYPSSSAGSGRYVTHYAFRMRLTYSEREKIEIAQLDDPVAAIELRRNAAKIRTNIKDWESAQYIDLDDQTLLGGLMAFEALGLLGSGRAMEIVNTTVLDRERP